ncbi:hypothetical protein [Stenotrophomonas sp.]|uniref:hypothetical protein n=1 Tax=Stenotrophomonas sp. TaxID=69392 RepID=UPI0028AE6056|nr:hypothetical protein [Stenotrophomonas sp.]
MQFAKRNEEPNLGILLKYNGPSVDDGSMDVYDAAANMVAFSNYVVAAAKQFYGDVEVKAEVKAFQHGSFETDLVFHLAGLGITVLTATPDVRSVLTAVKESIDLFKFLRGKPPQNVEHVDQSNNVAVTNVNGDVFIVQTESLTLTMDEKAGKAAAQFVGQALSRNGVEKIEIRSGGKQIATASHEDASFFCTLLDEVPVSEQTMRMGLTIQEPSFKDGSGHKWTMWDGETSLQYAMEDENFITRIDDGESFRKGDVLVCEVRFTQTRTGSKFKIQRAIAKVLDHKGGHEQSQFELVPPAH